jgi:hypothetical protein
LLKNGWGTLLAVLGGLIGLPVRRRIQLDKSAAYKRGWQRCCAAFSTFDAPAVTAYDQMYGPAAFRNWSR